MATTTANQNLNVNKRVYEAFLSGANKYTEQGLKIFNEVSPERMTEMASISTGLGLLDQVAENAVYPEASLDEFGSKSVTQVMYRKALPYSMLMQRFDNYRVVEREAARGGFRMKQTRDNVMSSILRGATTTTTTWDSLSLANASHLIGTTGATQSNVVTGGLTEPNLITAIQRLFEMRDHDNVVGSLPAAQLIVPAALDNTAKRLLASMGSPSTANRYTNPLMTAPNANDGSGIEVVTWAQLGAVNPGGSDTTCYLVADKMFHRLDYLESIGPKMTPITPDKTNNGSFSYRFDYAAAAVAVDYFGVVAITA